MPTVPLGAIGDSTCSTLRRLPAGSVVSPISNAAATGADRFTRRAYFNPTLTLLVRYPPNTALPQLYELYRSISQILSYRV